MTAEALLNAWAAARLDIPVERVVGVEFDEGEEYAYSTWTIEPAYTQAVVTYETLIHPDYPDIWENATRVIDVTDQSIPEILTEILETAGK